VGCCDAKEGTETAQVVADHINELMLEGLGLSNASAEDIPKGKVANMTTDTAAVMRRAAEILSEDYPLFKGMQWTPCSCHVLNLFLTDQEKQFSTVSALLARGKLIVAIFRNSAPRKLFQRCASPPNFHTQAGFCIHCSIIMNVRPR
jgi:hypothetical protein